jgi:hypothetical protein
MPDVVAKTVICGPIKSEAAEQAIASTNRYRAWWERVLLRRRLGSHAPVTKVSDTSRYPYEVASQGRVRGAGNAKCSRGSDVVVCFWLSLKMNCIVGRTLTVSAQQAAEVAAGCVPADGVGFISKFTLNVSQPSLKTVSRPIFVQLMVHHAELDGLLRGLFVGGCSCIGFQVAPPRTAAGSAPKRNGAELASGLHATSMLLPHRQSYFRDNNTRLVNTCSTAQFFSH